MADVITWNMTKLISEWREYTGRSSTADIADAVVAAIINDYYVNQWPNDGQVNEFDTFFTQALSATDDGVYDLSSDVDRLDDPVTINGNPIMFFRDRELFFTGNHLHGHHHRFLGFNLTTLHNSHTHKFEDEQFITNPTLAIGTSDTAKVLHAAFDYNINDFAYSKATSEVALTGSTIPQNKYGAWSFKIDDDEVITVAAATDNATGYDTPRKALEALGSSDSESAYMGYVTVISTDSGGFIPGTTALSDSAVTDTFTDGRFETRTTPISALLYGSKLYVHPKPNDIYEFKALVIADRPTALETATVLADAKWGPPIALNSAILWLLKKGETERIAELLPGAKFHKDGVRSDKIKRLLGSEIERNF